MPFLRQSHFQRPKQFGPASVVNTTLRDRLEKLGVAWELAAVLAPFWDQAGEFPQFYGYRPGFFNRGSDDYGSLNGGRAIWNPDGLDCTTQARKFGVPLSVDANTSEGTSIIGFDHTNPGVSATQYFLYLRRGIESNRVGYKINNGIIYLVRGGDGTGVSSSSLAHNGKASYVLNWNLTNSTLRRAAFGAGYHSAQITSTANYQYFSSFNRIGMFDLPNLTSQYPLREGIALYSYLFRKQLPESAIDQLIENPYGIWRPLPRPTYFIPKGDIILPIVDTAALTEVTPSVLSSSDEGLSTDSVNLTGFTASPIPGVETGAATDPAGIMSTITSIISGIDSGIASDQAVLTDMVSSILSSTDSGEAKDTGALVSANITPLSGSEKGFITDVAALVTATATPLSGMTGNELIDSAQLAQATAVILPAVEYAKTSDNGDLTSVPVTIMISSEMALALDNSVLVNAQGIPIACIETLAVVDAAILTSVETTIIIASVGGDQEISAIFGTPIIIPVLQGHPSIQTQLQGTPSIIRR